MDNRLPLSKFPSTRLYSCFIMTCLSLVHLVVLDAHSTGPCVQLTLSLKFSSNIYNQLLGNIFAILNFLKLAVLQIICKNYVQK